MKDEIKNLRSFVGLLFAELLGVSQNPKPSEHLLYDHCPLKLNDDDYQRVSRIPKRKVFSFAIHFIQYLLYCIFIRILIFSISTLSDIILGSKF
jgi:hypothetical protein